MAGSIGKFGSKGVRGCVTQPTTQAQYYEHTNPVTQPRRRWSCLFIKRRDGWPGQWRYLDCKWRHRVREVSDADVLAAILSSPAGPAERLDTDLCRTGSIYIHLTVANVEVFKQEVPRIIYAHPFSGVGDAAFWNPAGAFSSVKRPNRGCDISVIGPPPKIHEEALARKVGEICNKLFALP